jgi:hypothetical protein
MERDKINEIKKASNLGTTGRITMVDYCRMGKTSYEI